MHRRQLQMRMPHRRQPRLRPARLRPRRRSGDRLGHGATERTLSPLRQLEPTQAERPAVGRDFWRARQFDATGAFGRLVAAIPCIRRHDSPHKNCPRVLRPFTATESQYVSRLCSITCIFRRARQARGFTGMDAFHVPPVTMRPHPSGVDLRRHHRAVVIASRGQGAPTHATAAQNTKQ